MDPDTAYASLTDSSLDIESRLDAGVALENWLLGGGYPPAALVRLIADIQPYGYAKPSPSRLWIAGFLASLLIEQAISRTVASHCTGTEYPVNPDAPEEGTDIHHVGPCPQHPA